MKEPRALTMGERWRLITSRSVEDHRLEEALASLPSIRSPPPDPSRGHVQWKRSLSASLVSSP